MNARGSTVTDLAHFVGGDRLSGESGRFADVYDPARGDVGARVPLANAQDVAAAVAVARRALPEWAAAPAAARARILFRFKTLIERDFAGLAATIVGEHGKVLSDAEGSLTRGLEVVEFACGIPHLLKGEFSESVGTGIDSWSMRQPVGVCVGITPFNFPAMVPMWMFPVALACGNTFILKPSEKVPSCSLRLAALLREAGLPDGVFNVLHGDGETVDALLTHPDVAAVSFVGSAPVARHVYATAAAGGKRVQALAGAKNHMVVMPDADLGNAVDALMGAAYGSAGERCMAVSVAVAVGGVADGLVDALARRIEALRLGPGSDPAAEMGPLISAAHRAKVVDYLGEGVREGATLVVDGRAVHLQGYEGGFFLGPSLFDHVRPGMRIYEEEIFGPVLCVVRADDFADALAITNGHTFGNGAAIFTSDGRAARTFASNVACGMVGINVAIPVPMAFHSFGGWKHSLFGDCAVHGAEGVRFYTRLKTVTARWPGGGNDNAGGGANFAMPTMARS